MLGGLAMPTHGSPDLRDMFFLPLDMLGGLALPTYGSFDLRIIVSSLDYLPIVMQAR